MRNTRIAIAVVLVASNLSFAYRGASAPQRVRVDSIVEELARTIQEAGEGLSPSSVLKLIAANSTIPLNILERDFRLSGLRLATFAAGAVIASKTGQPFSEVVRLLRTGATPGELAARHQIDILSIERPLEAIRTGVRKQTGQTRPADQDHCITLAFTPVKTNGDTYLLKSEARDECAKCSIVETTAVILINDQYCKFPVRVEPGDASPGVIIIDFDAQSIIARGGDASALQKLVSQMCELGGAPIPLNQSLRVQPDTDNVRMEIDQGVLKRITGPLPMLARVIARDTCQKMGAVVTPIRSE
jgi:hypothetical protein